MSPLAWFLVWAVLCVVLFLFLLLYCACALSGRISRMEEGDAEGEYHR